MEEDLNEDLVKPNKLITDNDIVKLKQQTPGFDDLLKKAEENKLSREDLEKFTKNPFVDPDRNKKVKIKEKIKTVRSAIKEQND